VASAEAIYGTSGVCREENEEDRFLNWRSNAKLVNRRATETRWRMLRDLRSGIDEIYFGIIVLPTKTLVANGADCYDILESPARVFAALLMPPPAGQYVSETRQKPRGF
jgi:hypothetical protein